MNAVALGKRSSMEPGMGLKPREGTARRISSGGVISSGAKAVKRLEAELQEELKLQVILYISITWTHLDCWNQRSASSS